MVLCLSQLLPSLAWYGLGQRWSMADLGVAEVTTLRMMLMVMLDYAVAEDALRLT